MSDTCKKCLLLIAGESIKCCGNSELSTCKVAFHPRCLNITNACSKELFGNSGLRWICTQCRESKSTCISAIAQLLQTFKEDIVKEVDKRFSDHIYTDIITALQSNTNSSNSSGCPTDLQKQNIVQCSENRPNQVLSDNLNTTITNTISSPPRVYNQANSLTNTSAQSAQHPSLVDIPSIAVIPPASMQHSAVDSLKTRIEKTRSRSLILPSCTDKQTILPNCTSNTELKHGTSDIPVEVKFIPNTETKFWLFVTRVDPSTTINDMRELISKQLGTTDILIYKIRPHNMSYELKFISFKIGVPISLLNLALEPSTWPRGMVYKRFISHGNPKNENAPSSQSRARMRQTFNGPLLHLPLTTTTETLPLHSSAIIEPCSPILLTSPPQLLSPSPPTQRYELRSQMIR